VSTITKSLHSSFVNEDGTIPRIPRTARIGQLNLTIHAQHQRNGRIHSVCLYFGGLQKLEPQWATFEDFLDLADEFDRIAAAMENTR
jgi:hypothetical protein